MTNKQRDALLRSAMADLRKTTKGYTVAPNGTHWRRAFGKLDRLQADLGRAPVPNLGPIVAGGTPLLLQDCTHLTSGLQWPALDDGFAVGRAVVAPEACVVYDNTSSAQGGDAFYVRGASGIDYWVAHITTVPALGAKFAKGATMTRISADHPRPHVHLGIDARPLIGKHLVAHTNYTHGAPKIGVQLTRALEA